MVIFTRLEQHRYSTQFPQTRESRNTRPAMRPKQNSCHHNGSSCLQYFSCFPGLLDKGRFRICRFYLRVVIKRLQRYFLLSNSRVNHTGVDRRGAQRYLVVILEGNAEVIGFVRIIPKWFIQCTVVDFIWLSVIFSFLNKTCSLRKEKEFLFR